MNPVKTFMVFGEPVQVLVFGEITGGSSNTLTRISPPGGVRRPHSRVREDETFFVLEGDYELLQDGVWHKFPAAQAVHANRGGVNTFRNMGTTTAKC